MPTPFKITRFDKNRRHGYRVEQDGKVIAKDLIGVTTILNILEKKGIPPWAAREAGKAIGKQIKAWMALNPSERPIEALNAIADEAIKDAYKYSESLKDKAAERGTDGHTIAELIAIAHTPPDPFLPDDDFLIDVLRRQPSLASDDIYLIALAVREWFKRTNPTVISAERMAVCVPCAFGCTIDLECTIGGEPWLIDLKTGKGIWDTVALQVCGQSHALSYTQTGEHYIPLTPHRQGVLWVSMDARDGCELIETKCSIGAFQSVRESYFWRRSNSWRA